ncbi:MAG: CPBP family intramembrane metalloprotease [Cytophagales bacterium]|nr:CPBP family intramembrane metalloprotease [Cytophagales bacterium]
MKFINYIKNAKWSEILLIWLLLDWVSIWVFNLVSNGSVDTTPLINLYYKYGFWIIVLFYIPFAALIEELIFRMLPFVFINLTSGFKLFKFLKGRYLEIVILSSIIFGYAHGGFINIFIQGIGGFGLYLVFLKTQTSTNSTTLATLVATLCHALYNISIFLYYYLNYYT